MPEAKNPYHGATHIEWSCSREHSRSEGIVALPIASASARASLVRLHAPIEYEVIYWAAVRRHGAPQVPSWKAFLFSGNTNRVFLGGNRSAVLPVPTAGGHVFAITGMYVYCIPTTEGLDSSFVLGSMPWETINPSENYLPSSNFDPRFILGTMTPSEVDLTRLFPPKLIYPNISALPLPNAQEDSIPVNESIRGR